MKTLFTLFLTLLLTTSAIAQGSDWIWARSSYSSYPMTYGVTGLKVITDAAGDVYTIGSFYKTDLGFDTAALKNNGGNNPGDAFIVKHSSKGEFRWVRQISGTGSTQGDYINGICLDPRGNLLVAGSFSSRFLTLAGTQFTNLYNSTNDAYIAKIDKDGKFLWAKHFGGAATQNITEITCNGRGDIFVAGQFNSNSMSFGSFGFTNKNTDGSYDMFIARLDSTGIPVWAKSYGGKDQEGSSTLALGKDGRLHHASYMYSDSIQMGNQWLKNGNMIYAVFDTSGAVVSAIVPGYGEINKIICDHSGNILIAGAFSYMVRFGALSITGIAKPNQGGDFFLFKSNSSGDPLWLKSGSGSGNGYNYNTIHSIASDANGNVYAAGDFYNDSLSVGKHLYLNPYGNIYRTDIFILKYSSGGDLLSTRGIEGNDGKSVLGICTDKNNDVYFTGNYSSSPCRFGKDLTLKPSVAGGSEVFIAKLSANATGLEDIDDQGPISLYPNPVTDELRLNAGPLQGPSMISIYNLQGKVVFNAGLFPGDAGEWPGINISGLAPGVYILQFNSAGSIHHLKFVKQ